MKRGLAHERRHSFAGHRRTGSVVAAVAMATLLVASASASAYEFTRVNGLEPAVSFWQRVYGVWSVNEIALHDTENFELVYRVVKVPARGETVNGVTRKSAVQRATDETRQALNSLDRKRPTSSAGLSDVEREVFENLASVRHDDKYAHAGRVRGQNGLREKFIIGYRGAGAWEPEVRARLKEAGLPEDLVALAYVESLMTIRATSHAGAVGIWQFMPATGREYMHINSVLDEREDPILATDAAAKYLRTALANVGPWPVAVTSYNYGRGGMKRAIDTVGTTDFASILARYHHGRFGFAARNYYASFLAVDGIMKNVDKFFPGVQQRGRWKYDVVRLPFPVLASQLYDEGAISKNDLVFLNPALTERARTGKEILPRGLPLRVPRGQSSKFTETVLAFSVDARTNAESTIKATHVANGKETVKAVARKYGVSVDVVASLTGLSAKQKIGKGVRISIPSSTTAKYSLFPTAIDVSIPDAPNLPARALVASTPLPLAPLPPLALAPLPSSSNSARASSADTDSASSTSPRGRVKVVKVTREPMDDVEIVPVDVVSSARHVDPGIVDAVSSAVDDDFVRAFVPNDDALSSDVPSS